MEKIDLNTFGKPIKGKGRVPDPNLPWVDPIKHSWKELQTINSCQRCGKGLSLKGDKWINVDRRTCETCWRA